MPWTSHDSFRMWGMSWKGYKAEQIGMRHIPTNGFSKLVACFTCTVVLKSTKGSLTEAEAKAKIGHCLVVLCVLYQFCHSCWPRQPLLSAPFLEALLVKQQSSSISSWMQDTINLPFMWGEAVLCDSLMSLRVCRSKESWTALMRLRILSTKLKALPLDKPTGSLELLPSHKSWHWNAEPVSKISLRYARLSESHHSNDWRTEALCMFCWHFLLMGLVVLSYLLLDGSVATSQDMLRRTKDIMVAGSKLSVPWLHRSTGLSFETLFFLVKLNHVSLGLTSGLEFKDLLTRYNWHMFSLETGRSSRWKKRERPGFSCDQNGFRAWHAGFLSSAHLQL